MSKLVSVILPTYNRGRSLAASMQSVLKQSHHNLELIVVDDGSSDNTPQIVAASGDPRVRYTAHAVRKGAAAARNTGLRVAAGEFVAFQDSDDVWRQDKLSAQVAALERTGADVSVCSHRLLGPRRVTELVRTDGVMSKNDVIARLLKGASISTPTIVARTDALRDVGGFDDVLDSRQDFELCLRLALRHRFVFVSRTLVDMHVSSDSISGNAVRFAAATEHIVGKHAALLQQHRRDSSAMLLRAAKYLGYANDYKESRRYVRRALKANPLNVRAMVLLCALTTHTVPLLRRVRG
jgi:glycosyltransferase involved in cell wall biosynthesis